MLDRDRRVVDDDVEAAEESAAPSTNARTAAGSVRSPETITCPSPGRPARTFSASSAESRWCTATTSPRSANARATASPIPRDAPVTNTLRPDMAAPYKPNTMRL
ncbi:hypothetical protein GCM10027610_102760 [Dactylosporangium cerinum]